MIDYKNFKQDCLNIIEPYLATYGFRYDSIIEDEFIIYYTNDKYKIKISMLDNFPNIGVSWGFLDLNEKWIKPSLIDSFLEINPKQSVKFYEEFKNQNNLNDYSSQMHYNIEVMERFYKPILTGEIQLEDIY